MGAEHSPDIVWKAQELYCVDCLSFAKVAELTGVTATTLKAWSKKYAWRAKRTEIAQIEAEIRMDIIRSRKKALDMLIASADGKECSQMAFAVSSLESLAMKQKELAFTGKLPTAPSLIKRAIKKPKITTRSEAIKNLGEAVENKLGFALQNPEAINSSTIQDISKILNLMDDLKASLPKTENEQAEKASQGISKSMEENIKKALKISD